MKEVNIKVEKRTPAKKGVARKMRSEGMIPAVIYGKGGEVSTISVSDHDFKVLYKKNLTQAIYNLELDGSVKPTLIKEIQKDKVDESILHLDFFEFDKDKKTEYLVPVTTVGQAPGVVVGGILSITKNEVWVKALPYDIPDKIEVDVSGLQITKSVRIKDMQNEKFHLLANPNDPLVTILAPRGLEVDEILGNEEGGEEGAETAPAAEEAKSAEAAS